MREHIKDGQFQSDKYPTCPPGKVPLSVKDPMAQDLLAIYAKRREVVDAEFAADLEYALMQSGYERPSDAAPADLAVLIAEVARLSATLNAEGRLLLDAARELLARAKATKSEPLDPHAVIGPARCPHDVPLDEKCFWCNEAKQVPK